MVDAIVSSAIEKLGAFIAQEVNILLEVKDNLRWLKDELRYLQSSVRSAESRLEEEQIRNWVEDVRDVANDAIKILSDFSAHQEEYAAPKQGILDRVRACFCLIKEEATLYDIGKEIDSLKKRIELIKNRRNDYRIDNILATPNKQQKERTLLRITAINNQVEVVGFEDDFKTLMGEFNSEDLSLKVISIHGMGGLGKTSLATKLYDSSELRNFDTRTKVCVSNEYNIKDVLKRIVTSFMGAEYEQKLSTMDEYHLLQHLPELLQSRGRYLVLIDDIWDIKVWDQIKIAFPNQKNGSRIIITTRNKTVAETVDDKSFVHQLRFLTEDESWELFCKRAEATTQNMEKLGKEMVEEFISEAEEGEGVIMEDLAEDCLKELINRNLLQVNKLLWNGEVESLRVHDLVRLVSIRESVPSVDIKNNATLVMQEIASYVVQENNIDDHKLKVSIRENGPVDINHDKALVTQDIPHYNVQENNKNLIVSNIVDNNNNMLSEFESTVKVVEEHLQVHRSWRSNSSSLRTCDGRGVYVYDLPPKFNKDLVAQCSDMSPWLDFCQFFRNEALGEPIPKLGKAWYNTHQYSLEPIFHSRVMKHPCRVYNENEAKLFYVPFYGGLDILRWHFKNASPDVKDTLALELVEWLKLQKPWALNSGKDHVFVLGKVSWDFRRRDDSPWGSTFLSLEKMQNPIKLLIERQPWHVNDIGIPHPTYFQPHSDEDIISWQFKIIQSSRNNLVSFAGGAIPDSPDSIRSVLINQCTLASTGTCKFHPFFILTLKPLYKKARDDMRRYIVHELLPGLVYGDSSSDFEQFQDAFSITMNNLLEKVTRLG
ncbi:hypothetical protein AgCh_023560 [Apium graveolens]